MHVKDEAGKRAWQILLATSWDIMFLKRRGFKMRVDDVAGSICQALPARAHARLRPLGAEDDGAVDGLAVTAQVECESKS